MSGSKLENVQKEMQVTMIWSARNNKNRYPGTPQNGQKLIQAAATGPKSAARHINPGRGTQESPMETSLGTRVGFLVSPIRRPKWRKNVLWAGMWVKIQKPEN